jgi:hypothetical protein
MNGSKNNQMVIGFVIVAILLGGLWFLTRGATPPANDMTGTDAMEDSGTVPIDLDTVASTTSDDESVLVPDQPAGDVVAVSNVTFTQSGWIAVRDDRGWTLGAGRFDEGMHSDVMVKLLRTTTPGERYQVLLYIDDGDKEFDLDKEILVTRSDGSVAGTTFGAQ